MENLNDFDAHSGNDLYAMMSQQFENVSSEKVFSEKLLTTWRKRAHSEIDPIHDATMINSCSSRLEARPFATR